MGNSSWEFFYLGAKAEIKPINSSYKNQNIYTLNSELSKKTNRRGKAKKTQIDKTEIIIIIELLYSSLKDLLIGFFRQELWAAESSLALTGVADFSFKILAQRSWRSWDLVNGSPNVLLFLLKQLEKGCMSLLQGAEDSDIVMRRSGVLLPKLLFHVPPPPPSLT